MGRLFELIDEYRGRYAPHEPTYSRVAEQVGVSRQTLLNWRTPTKLLDKAHLVALARVTQVPYQRVLDALLDDIGYLREDQVPVASPARPASAGRPRHSTKTPALVMAEDQQRKATRREREAEVRKAQEQAIVAKEQLEKAEAEWAEWQAARESTERPRRGIQEQPPD